MYKVAVTYKKLTEAFGIEVQQTVKHVDVTHAQNWIKEMGSKIWDVKIQNIV